jgi:hypothetical protein
MTQLLSLYYNYTELYRHYELSTLMCYTEPRVISTSIFFNIRIKTLFKNTGGEGSIFIHEFGHKKSLCPWMLSCKYFVCKYGHCKCLYTAKTVIMKTAMA